MKNFKLRKGFLYAVVFIWILIQLSFTFSDSNGIGITNINFSKYEAHTNRNNYLHESPSKLNMLYNELHLSEKGLTESSFKMALKGFHILKRKGLITNDRMITIIDFTQPSYKKRMFVLDLQTGKLLFNNYVAHGQNTGAAYANRFSNKPESLQSSLGFYTTSKTYNGKNGFSMQLKGLEPGINDLAEQRAIVMHGAPYVSESFIRAKGYIGRSHGCPAVPSQMNKLIIENIKNGSLLFIYSNDKKYLQQSQLLAP
ncbi:MAG: murein L,D-transpeptidase catalytic domain family protein [Ferruginibacter sp.]